MWSIILSFLVILFDQLTKSFIYKNLPLNLPQPIINNFFYITLIHNKGACFGIFPQATFLFVIISIAAIILIIHYVLKTKGNRIFRVALALILGGAVGNLIDRLRFGYVIDFLDFRIWPVFNIADSAITIGTILFIVSFFKKNR